MALLVLFFFFNDTATTEIYTLSLHDALPICGRGPRPRGRRPRTRRAGETGPAVTGRPKPARRAPRAPQDRKSTRLNSSHANISYAVFCLKKKKNTYIKKFLTDAKSTNQDIVR